MRKFKVLEGTYNVFVRHPETRKIIQTDRYKSGDIVESEIDLCKRGNRPGARKFVEVHEETPVKLTPPIAPEDVEEEEHVEVQHPEDVVDESDVLLSSTIEELRSIAERNNIDLGPAKLKGDIVAIIRAAL